MQQHSTWLKTASTCIHVNKILEIIFFSNQFGSQIPIKILISLLNYSHVSSNNCIVINLRRSTELPRNSSIEIFVSFFVIFSRHSDPRTDSMTHSRGTRGKRSAEWRCSWSMWNWTMNFKWLNKYIIHLAVYHETGRLMSIDSSI